MKKGIKVIDDSQFLIQAKIEFSSFITTDILDQYTQNHYSMSSLLAMRSDWNLYVDYCYRYGATVFPPQLDTILSFLENESVKRKFSSVRRYSITLSNIYTLLHEADPLRAPHIRSFLLKLRIEKHGDLKQTDAFSSSHLKLINKKMSKSTKLSDIRDLAIYNLMFECALKRSELRDMTFEQISKKNNNTFISINDCCYQLSSAASISLYKWLTIQPQDNGYLFRAIDKHGNVGSTKLNDSSIFRIFRNAASILDMPGLKFSGHSARIGAAQEMHKQGEKIVNIQHFGRWHSPVMPSQYVGKISNAEMIQLRYKKFKPWG